MVGHHWTPSAPINNEYVIIANRTDQSVKHVILRQISRWKFSITALTVQSSSSTVLQLLEKRIQLISVECATSKNRCAFLLLLLLFMPLVHLHIRSNRFNCSGNIRTCEIGEFSVVYFIGLKRLIVLNRSYHEIDTCKRMNWQPAHAHTHICTYIHTFSSWQRLLFSSFIIINLNDAMDAMYSMFLSCTCVSSFWIAKQVHGCVRVFESNLFLCARIYTKRAIS